MLWTCQDYLCERICATDIYATNFILPELFRPLINPQYKLHILFPINKNFRLCHLNVLRVYWYSFDFRLWLSGVSWNWEEYFPWTHLWSMVRLKSILFLIFFLRHISSFFFSSRTSRVTSRLMTLRCQKPPLFSFKVMEDY